LGSQSTSTAVPRWISWLSGPAILIAVVALVVVLTYHPLLSEVSKEIANLQSQNSQLKTQIQNMNNTLHQTQLRLQNLTNRLQALEAKEANNEEEIKRIREETLKTNQTETEKLLLRIKELEKRLSKIENTTWDNVNNYVKNKKPGWDAKNISRDLEERFWVETKIITQDGVQYLFLHFRCNCSTEWWWVTYQGLKPASEAPVQP
jgi:DNA repair exonuclease SbcCD ATPase subunit